MNQTHLIELGKKYAPPNQMIIEHSIKYHIPIMTANTARATVRIPLTQCPTPIQFRQFLSDVAVYANQTYWGTSEKRTDLITGWYNYFYPLLQASPTSDLIVGYDQGQNILKIYVDRPRIGLSCLELCGSQINEKLYTLYVMSHSDFHYIKELVGHALSEILNSAQISHVYRVTSNKKASHLILHFVLNPAKIMNLYQTPDSSILPTAKSVHVIGINLGEKTVSFYYR
jgi:hypothetical protein